MPQSLGQIRFPNADWAAKSDVLVPFNEVQSEQIHQTRFIDADLGRPSQVQGIQDLIDFVATLCELFFGITPLRFIRLLVLFEHWPKSAKEQQDRPQRPGFPPAHTSVEYLPLDSRNM
jgi:hypothetical protein